MSTLLRQRAGIATVPLAVLLGGRAGRPAQCRICSRLTKFTRLIVASEQREFNEKTYRAGIIGLGYIGGADQVSGDALGQAVADLDGTHFDALRNHPRVELVAGRSRDGGRRQRFEERSGLPTFENWQELLEQFQLGHRRLPRVQRPRRGLGPVAVDRERPGDSC